MDHPIIFQFKLYAHLLLIEHYGLTLNDTELDNTDIITHLINNGDTPITAINYLVDIYGLKKLSQQRSRHISPYINQLDLCNVSLLAEKLFLNKSCA